MVPNTVKVIRDELNSNLQFYRLFRIMRFGFWLTILSSGQWEYHQVALAVVIKQANKIEVR